MKIYVISLSDSIFHGGHIAGVFSDKRLVVEWLFSFVDSADAKNYRTVCVEVWEENTVTSSSGYVFQNIEIPGFELDLKHVELNSEGIVRFFADDRY